MKGVYTAHNLPEVGIVKSMLEEAGMPCIIENAQLQGVMGEGAGIDASPGVNVKNDADHDRAEALVHKYLNSEGNQKGADWTCEKCGEKHSAQFKSCWKCSK